MKKRKQNGKTTWCTSENILQSDKENLFSKFIHTPSSSSYKGCPSEIPLMESISSEMKDLSKKDELKEMPTQGETHSESEIDPLRTEETTTTKKILHDDSKDRFDRTFDDFEKSQIEKKQKLKKRYETPVFPCIVCQSDLTHLDLKKRTIHINKCIDGQSTTIAPSQESVEQNTFILDCPLCFKHFPTSEARCSHIKKCGKSRGLTTQSVVQAIQLQERHLLERRALGLPLNNKPAKQPKKPAMKKFLIKPKSAMESDMHLAKALSLSLKENKNMVELEANDSEDSLPNAMLQAPLKFQNPGKFVTKKETLKPTALLLLREEAERKKIILEKVNSIIASSIEYKNDGAVEDVKHDSTEQKRTFLWDLCGKAEDKNTYYVEQLLDWISPSDVEVGSKLCNLSQIPGHRIFTQLPHDYTFSAAAAEKKNDENTVHEENESPSLIRSLRSLIGNCWMSDVDIHTASGIVIPAHKLFLALRCPFLRNALDEPITVGKHVLHWENTSFDAALNFLNFIYTGSAEWKEDIIDELHELAVKYDVTDLLNILDCNKETLELLICDDTNKSIENSVMDMENLPKGINQNISVGEQKHNFESSNICVETEFQNTDNRYCNEKNNLNEIRYKTTQQKNVISDEIVYDVDDVVCIQNNDATEETIINQNGPLEQTTSDEDIFILNENKTSDFKKKLVSNINLETCCTSSNSSNDSCKVLNSNVSSDYKTPFDIFQEEVLNMISSKTPNKSEDNAYKCTTYCTSSYSSPSKTSDENINLLERSVHNDDIVPLKISPLPSIRNTCNKNEISLKNAPKIGSTEKKSESLSNFRNDVVEVINDAIIVIENEQSTAETKHCSSKKNCSANSYAHSPRKVSPFKVSKLKSPSFDDFNAMLRSQNMSIQNGSNNSEQRNMDISLNSTEHLILNDYSVSPKISRHFRNQECLQNISSPKGKPALSCRNEDKSYKRNLDCSLNENIYVTSLSSPEILVCDSDKESEAGIQNSPLCKSQNISDNERESALYNSNFVDPKKISVFTSNFNKESSRPNESIKSKVKELEVIYCNSDSNDGADVTIKFQSPYRRNNDNFEKNSKLNESNFIECDGALDIKECTPMRMNTSNVVLDVIDCSSNSSDDVNTIEQLQSSSKTKELIIEDDIFDDKCMDSIPLADRIQASKLKTNSYNALKDLVPSSPESPWIFQTDKCSSRPLENHPNMFKSSCSVQHCNITPKLSSKQKKSKSSAIGNQAEKSNYVTVPNSLQAKFKLSDSPVTPLPDYRNMVTPDLKQALKRVGVKPLPRKKAVAVLSHIYDETHPWNADCTEESLEFQTQPSQKSSQQKKNLSLPKKRKQIAEISDRPSKKTVLSQAKKTTEIDEASAKQISNSGQLYSQTKTSSPENISSSPDAANNSSRDYFNLASDFSDSSQPDSKDNVGNIIQYIQSNDELYNRILTYSPINLIEVQHELKENGMSVSVQKLMDFLDEQCITFTCPRKEEYRKKQQARTQRFRKRMIAKLTQQKSSAAS